MTFAGILFLLAAAFNIIDGLVALAEPKHFFVGENGVVISDYNALGIVLLVIAGIQILVGFGVLNRMTWAQVVGILLAVIAAIVQLTYFKHYPAWAVIGLILDAVIIYALTVHSDEFSSGRRRR